MIFGDYSHHRRVFVTLLAVVSLLAPVTGSSGSQDPKLSEYTPRLTDYDYRDSRLDQLIETIAERECLKVVFDGSVEDSVRIRKVDLRVRNASPIRAIQALLESQELDHEFIGLGTLVVYRGTIPDQVKRTDVVMKTILSGFVDFLAQHQGFKAILHESAESRKYQKVNLELRGVSVIRAFEVGLGAQGLTYHHADCATIVIYPDRALVTR